MEKFILILLFVNIIYLVVQFAREEAVVEEYEGTVSDVEARLSWAYSRKVFPLGMETQLTVSRRLLTQARQLWEERRWNQAHDRIIEAQEAMNKAQKIYVNYIRNS